MSARTLLASSAPKSAALVGVAVALAFASEGVRKLLDPDAPGTGRFANIGIPASGLMGPLVGGVVEVVCGLLVLVGLLTRLAAVPLSIDMLVAIASTKVPCASFLVLAATGPLAVDAWLLSKRSLGEEEAP